MKGQTKIQLSSYEMELINNAGLILTKNAILEKVQQLLENLLNSQQQYIQSNISNLPTEVLLSSPKISKGENYKGLPYRVLDYPRYFDKENIFAIRTMFWWGNFFSITLHLSGRYKKEAEKKIIASRPELIKSNFYLCIHEKEWEHHFENDNYIPVGKLNKTAFKIQIMNKPFIKLAQKISLKKWNDAQKILISNYKQIITMLRV